MDLTDLAEQKSLGKFICSCDPEHYKPDLVCRLTQQDQCKLIANDPLFNVKLSEPELVSKRLDKLQLFVLDQLKPLDEVKNMRLLPQQLLRSWLNKLNIPVRDFTADFADGKTYLKLLKHYFPDDI